MKISDMIVSDDAERLFATFIYAGRNWQHIRQTGTAEQIAIAKADYEDARHNLEMLALNNYEWQFDPIPIIANVRKHFAQ